MAKRNALGKGLSALLENAETDITSFEPRVLNSVANIPISQIAANPFQPRSAFEQEAMEELAESIRVHGIIQPITVRKAGYEKYEIISGERRTRASILAGLTDIPAYIRLANDQEMLEMALIENIQREELNALDISFSFKRLLDECGLKMEELGERVGKKRSTVNNYLRLLKLPDDIQLGLKEGKIQMGHARALINVEDAEIQMAIYERTIAENLSVRKVEELVRRNEKTGGIKSSETDDEPFFELDEFAGYRQGIASRLGTKVDLRIRKGEQGSVIIHFKGRENLRDILAKLSEE